MGPNRRCHATRRNECFSAKWISPGLPVTRRESVPIGKITSYKPTSHYLCTRPDLDYFRFADDPGVISRCGSNREAKRDRIIEFTIREHFGPNTSVDEIPSVLEELPVDVFRDRVASLGGVDGGVNRLSLWKKQNWRTEALRVG